MNFEVASDFCKKKFLGKSYKSIRTDFKEHSTFYLVDKYFLKECIEPALVIFVKSENDDVVEYLHAEYVEVPKLQLNDFEKPYFDECTHLLVNQMIPFNKIEGQYINQRFASYLKEDFKWTYPLVDHFHQTQ
jgi:hypothetical protein